MARTPRAKKVITPKASDELLAALRFVALAQQETGAIYQTHTIIHNGWAQAFDGVVAAGHPINIDLSNAPHTLRLIDAFERCGEQLAVSQMEAGRVSVNSGAFRAVIPCAGRDDVTFPVPDPQVTPVTEELLNGFKAVSGLVSDNAAEVVTASALLKANSIVGTDRTLMIEYWHGVDLPPDLTIPKQFMKAIAKVPLKPTGFGYSPLKSITIYFENGAWLKTQMYSERWPDPSRILDMPTISADVDPGFFAAVDAVTPFSADGDVRLWDHYVTSHDLMTEGAQYELPNLGGAYNASARRLKIIMPLAKSLDLRSGNGILHFYGDRIRGALSMKRR